MNVSLSYEGEFGFTAILSLNVDKENTGLFANLFYYNPASGELEYICADRIDENGNANLKFTHASDYVIVIDAEDMQRAQNTDTVAAGETVEALTEETSNPQETASVDSPNTAAGWTAALLVAVMVLLAGGVWYVLKKKGEKKA